MLLLRGRNSIPGEKYHEVWAVTPQRKVMLCHRECQIMESYRLLIRDFILPQLFIDTYAGRIVGCWIPWMCVTSHLIPGLWTDISKALWASFTAQYLLFLSTKTTPSISTSVTVQCWRHNSAKPWEWNFAFMTLCILRYVFQETKKSFGACQGALTDWHSRLWHLWRGWHFPKGRPSCCGWKHALTIQTPSCPGCINMKPDYNMDLCLTCRKLWFQLLKFTVLDMQLTRNCDVGFENDMMACSFQTPRDWSQV